MKFGETTQAAAPELNQKHWQKVCGKKIYFGHQSVGYNIIDGISDLMMECNEKDLNLKETSDINDFSTPVFAHSGNGKNGDPKSKIDSFARLMKNGLGNKVDIAFFKFCYVDINSRSDLQKLFDYYVSVMGALEKKYPKTVFLHVTVPLTADNPRFTIMGRAKELVRKMMGKTTYRDANIGDNIARGVFNELIRKKYNENRIIDLAKLESTRPDGSVEIYNYNDHKYFALYRDFTYDAGHLNEKGQRVVAKHLLLKLSQL